jgi:predicted Zn-dependent protease
VNLRNLARRDQLLGTPVEANDGFAAGFVRNADEPPGDCVTEGFSRRFFCGEKAGEALGPRAFAHGVRPLFLGVDLAREPGASALIEAVTLDFRDIDPNPDDHSVSLLVEPRTRLGASGTPQDVGPGNSREPISIVPINKIEAEFITRLGLCLEERFLSPFIIRSALQVPKKVLNGVRGQLFTGVLATQVTNVYPPGDGYVLAVTDYDLYKISARYVFGEGDPATHLAIVSRHRLAPEFYGESTDENVLFQRTLKEAVRALGRAFGLRACLNQRCAMHHADSIFETDNQLSNLCDSCEKRARAGR